MAGGGSSKSAPGTPNSKILRSAAKASAAAAASPSSSNNKATPSKGGVGKRVRKDSNGIPMPSSTASSSSSSALHPSLPRPPSWQSSLVAINTHNNKTPSKKTKTKDKSKRISKPRTSGDERDPGDSVNSTEDELDILEDDDDEQESLMSIASPFTVTSTSTSTSSSNNTTKHATKLISSNATGIASAHDEKQNICVCVRLRPSADGAPELDNPIWELNDKGGRITASDNHPNISKRKTTSSEDVYDYRFDSILLPPHPTSNLYNDKIRQVVIASTEGYNGTIFSYGQTGSGKTHTMTGSDDEPGILPLAISDIFNQISNDTERGYLLRVSYLEIYNETLKDLLDPVKNKNQDLRLVEDKSGRIVVNNLKEEIVRSPSDVAAILNRGEDNRSVAGTDWNTRSSRSHCVFSMMIESVPGKAEDSIDPLDISSVSTEIANNTMNELSIFTTAANNITSLTTKNAVRVSQLNLIDLAGSERATSQEERRKEGAFINKSLLTLGNVIQKLAEGKNSAQHIPYRDSKLTRLLQTSLSGNARIAIVCTISPEARHGSESISTLKFAQRAAKIETRAERGLVLDRNDAVIAHLEEEMASLRNQLAQRNQEQNRQFVNEDELENERKNRKDAENQVQDHRMEIIRLNEQIDHLRKQILTGTSTSNPSAGSSGEIIGGIPRTPSGIARHYGDIGTGARPVNGARGNSRRLSELAFGVGSPLRPSSLGGALTGLNSSSSMRSISSALEAISSHGNASDNANTARLEEEIASLKEQLVAALAPKSCEDCSRWEQKATQATKELDERNQQLRLLSEGNAALSLKVNKAEAEIVTIHRQKADLESEVSKLSASLNAAANQHSQTVERLEASLKDRDNMLKSLKEEHGAELKKELKDHDNTISLLKKEHDAELDVVRSKMSAEIDSLRALRATTAIEMEAMRDQLKSQQAKTDAHAKESSGELAELRKAVAARDVQLAEMTSSHKKDAQDSQAKLKDAKQRMQSLEIELADSKTTLGAENVAAHDALKQANAKIISLEADIKARGAELTQLNDTLKTHQTELDSARRSSKETKEALEIRLGVAKEKYEQRISSMLATHEEKGREWQKELLSLESEVEEQQKQLKAQTSTIAKLRDELKNKEQERARIAHLKAVANAPPDYNALSNKIKAISNGGSSSSNSSDSGKSLNSSLGRSAGPRSDPAGEAAVSGLQSEVTALTSQLQGAKVKSGGLEDELKYAHARIASLEADIARFKKQVEQNNQLLRDLQEKTPPRNDDLAERVSQMKLEESAKVNASPSSISKTRNVLGAIGSLRTNTSITAPYRSSGLSTPTKIDGQASWLSSRPEPLPMPPGTPESHRKKRRQTTEHELQRLHASGIASRSKTILESPKLESAGTFQWEQRRSRHDELENYPSRVKKGSNDSVQSRYA